MPDTKIGKSVIAAAGAALLMSSGAAVQASDYPSQPIRVIVGFAAGGPNDIIARAYADLLSESLGTRVLVENHAGAGGNIAATLAANAAPDGYTLFAGSSSLPLSHVISDVSYDVTTDLAPISLLASAGFVMAVNPSLPVTTVAEFIERAQENPGGMKFGTSGVGTSPHLAWEFFMNAAEIEMVHVPYGGLSQGITDLMSGEIDTMFVSMPVAVPQVEEGTLTALAVTTANRNALLPDLPTVMEAGLEAFDFASWWAMFAPAGTPDEVIAKLNEAVVAAGESDQLAAMLTNQGAEVVTNSADELGALVLSEIERFRMVAEIAGMETN